MGKHDIQTYSKLAEGAKFFLDQSFKSIDDALQSEVAGEILTELILKIEPSEEDKAIFHNAKVPKNVIESLQFGKFSVLSEATILKFQLIWKHAIEEAKTRKHIFKLDHKIQTIELLGHLNNLGFFLETLTNRHLLFFTS